MPYVIQSLPESSVLIATIHADVTIDELRSALHELYARLKRRNENTVVHLVLDTTSQTYPSSVPTKAFMLVLSKLYEAFYRRRTLILWLAAHITYADMARYYAQRMCLPVYIRSDVQAIHTSIAKLQGATAPLDASTVTEGSASEDVITWVLNN